MDPKQKARNQAKHDWIRQSHRLANELEGTVQMIRGRLNLMENHEISEWQCLEGMLMDLQSMHVEMGLPQMVEKYVIFQQTEFNLYK